MRSRVRGWLIAKSATYYALFLAAAALAGVPVSAVAHPGVVLLALAIVGCLAIASTLAELSFAGEVEALQAYGVGYDAVLKSSGLFVICIQILVTAVAAVIFKTQTILLESVLALVILCVAVPLIGSYVWHRRR